MALHISRVEITNFRNFGRLILDPFPARAVIVGENGVGKSNFLHALRLVLDPTLPDSARMLRQEDIWSDSPKSMAEGVVVAVDIELSGYDTDDDAKAVLADCTVSTDPYRARITYRFEPLTVVGRDENVTETTPLEGLTNRLAPANYQFSVVGRGDPSNHVGRVRQDIAIRLLPALRDAESDLRSWRRNPLRDLLELLPPDATNLEVAAAALSGAMDHLALDANIGRLETLLSSRMTAMFGPRTPISPRLGFGSSEADELTRSVKLFVDAARSRSVTDASLGAANVLYLGLLIEALARQREAEAFVATILAVEEPEAHLHVTLQRRLFSYLLRSESTLILTTHSPHIAAVTPLDSFVVLRASGSGTEGRTTAALEISEDRRADLERYLNVSRAEILFASLVILVEGAAETYILPALAAALDFDLDSHGVVIASVEGVDFAPWVKLLGPSGLDVPYVVVTDGDAAPDANGRSEAGLRRGSSLRPELELVERIRGLRDLTPEASEVERSSIVQTLAHADVFVGRQTLEVDICDFVPDAIVAAFNELVVTAAARRDVLAGVTNEKAAAPDREIRATMLQRISKLGKGRFAQRLAFHLELVDVVTLARAALDVERTRSLMTDDLLLVSKSGYLLAALDRASVLSRAKSLFEVD